MILTYECLKEILIPIVSAVVGGLITFFGVWKTIRNQQKTDAIKRKNAIKPWIYLLSPNHNENVRIELKADEINSGESLYELYLKNTDNGIAIIDSVATENNVYKPTGNSIIEKNQEAYIKVHLLTNGTETLKKIKLIIKDIDGNSYEYQLIWGMDCFDQLIEIKS